MESEIQNGLSIYENFFSETEYLMKTYNVIYTNDNGSTFTKLAFLRGFKIQDDNLKTLFVILKIDFPPKLEI